MYRHFLLVVLALSGLSLAAPAMEAGADENIVEFHILPGTGGKAWNTPETAVVVPLGKTLRIFNDDSVVHQLHTFGVPCPHGDRFQPGQHWDCGPITEPYTPADGEMYDHLQGSKAPFYVKTK